MSRLKAIAREAWFRARVSPLTLVRWGLDRASDRYFDWKFGIVSSQRRSLAELGIELPGGYEHQPVSWGDFRQFMKRVAIRPRHDVFLDFGSGMGRALCLAATYPFRSVIGVEISSELNAIAERNISRVRSKFQCEDIRIITADAVTYAVPVDVTVAYFFAPFGPDLLRKVLDNIAASLRESPRRMSLLYYGSPLHDSPWNVLRNSPWLTLQSESILPTGRVGLVYANTMWTEKEIVPARA